MLTYDLTKSADSLYQCLYEYIKADICRGILEINQKMPSKRALSKNLGVSTITVEKAYDQLISEGYIYTIPKKGYYVSEIEEIAKVPKKIRIDLDITLPKGSDTTHSPVINGDGIGK